MNKPIELSNISKAKINLSFYVAEFDTISTMEDAKWLEKQILGDDPTSHQINIYDAFPGDHHTFYVGIEMKYLTFVIQNIETFNRQGEEW